MKYYIRKTLNVAWMRAVFGLKGEARRSHLGLLWWLIEPVLLFAIYSLVFQTIRAGRGEDLPILIITGLIPWIWTGRTCQNATGVLVGNKGSLLTVDLPILVFPVATVIQDGFKAVFVYMCGLAAVYFLGGDVGFGTIVLAAVVFLLQLLLLSGVAPVFSLIGAVLPDFRVALSALLIALMFGSEIFYSRTRFEGTLLADILYFNPIASLIHLLRGALHDRAFELDVLIVVLVWILALWALAVVLMMFFSKKLIMYLLR